MGIVYSFLKDKMHKMDINPDIILAPGENFTIGNGVDPDFISVDEATGQVTIPSLVVGGVTATGEPSGFQDHTTTTISYSAATRKFTITGTGVDFYYWHNGVKVTKVSGAAELTTAAHADASGIYYFYFDAADVLTVSSGFFDLSTVVPVAYVLYTTALNGGATDEGILFDERHGIVMDWATHRQLHLDVGAILGSGCGITAGTYALNSGVDAATTPGFDAGSIIDEDFVTAIPVLNDGDKYTIMYRLGATGIWDWYKNQTFPHYVSGGNACYNQWTGAAWQLTPLTSVNQYFNVFVCETNAHDSTLRKVCIQGQTLHTQSNNALAESILGLSWGNMPFNEIVPSYMLTYRHYTSVGGSNGAPSTRVNLYAVTRLVEAKLTSAAILAGSHSRFTSDFLPIEWAEDGTSPPAVTSLVSIGDAKIRVREFDDAADNDVIIPWKVPSQLISPASGLRFQVYGVVTNATGPADEGVVFELNGYSVGDGDSIDLVPGVRIKSFKTNWTGVQYDNFVTELSDVVYITDLAPDETVFFNLRRSTGDGDDSYAQNIGVYGIKIRYSELLG